MRDDEPTSRRGSTSHSRGGGRSGRTDGSGNATIRGVLDRPHAIATIKRGVALYLVLAVGYGILTAGIGIFGGGIVWEHLTDPTVLFSVGAFVSPIVALALGVRHGSTLRDEAAVTAYATTALTNAAGVLAVAIVGSVFFLGAAPPGSDVIGRLLGALAAVIVSMVAAGIVSVGAMWASERFPS